MKKIFLIFLCFISLTICGCVHGNHSNCSEEENNNTNTNPNNNQNNTTITFKNLGSYKVSVYYGSNPIRNNSIYTEVEANNEKSIDFTILGNNKATFYFVYNLTFGNNNAVFPYYPKEDSMNHKTIMITDNENNLVEIDPITNCDTNSAFLFVENNSTSQFRILLSSSPVKPYHKDDYMIKQNEAGIYEIRNFQDEDIITFDTTDLLSIQMEDNYKFPAITYEPGKIYTVTVTNNNENGAKVKIKASLKAISPFNIDTAKKMWSFSDSSFLYNWSEHIKPVIKTAYSKDNGIIMMGTLKSDPTSVGLTKIDQYGKASAVQAFSVSTKDINDVTSLTVTDFVEQSDGTIIMLLACESNDDFADMLIAYDFSKTTILWSYIFPDVMHFRPDSANKLILLQDNNVAVVGAVLDASEGSNVYDLFVPYVGVFDYTKKSDDGLSYIRNEEGCKTYLMDESFSNESQFCSAYFDGTNIYACGFTNFDAKYDSAIHNGIIYKFNKDLSSPTEIYKKEKCLFFTLSGNGSKWYTCGEYWKIEDGKLFGCYISSSMIANNPEVYPSFYSGAKQYSWFNQLCTYDNMVVMCGQTSDDKNGTTNPLPFVVAYDSAGNLLWENLSYKKWATALNIIPNTIGTYILQLTDKNNRQIHFVSADFLGNEVSD